MRDCRPVLVAVGREMFEEGEHRVFVYGIGWRPNRVYLGNTTSPLFSTDEWSWRDFKKEWNSRGWGVVVGGRRKLELEGAA